MALISYSDAVAIIHQHTTRELPVETVPLVLAAGRILASPLVAGENIPSRPNSAMDGYALLAEDLAGASVEQPARLRLIGEAAAGSIFQGSVGRGEAVRIMTGGLIPDGANAVIEVEATSEADGIVEARREVRLGAAIRRAGEDIAIGQEVMAAGRRLTPGDIGVLASLGVVNVPVRVKPKIGILSTGSEVIEPFRSPAPGQVRNSTAPALYAACMELGAEPIDLGIARDEPEELEEKLEEGLRYDILITTGGVSAGAYDYVQRVLPELGVEVRCHKVAIKPGKQILFGTYGDGNQRTLVFALPGNPVSTLLTFREFVAPAVRAMQRRSDRPMRFGAVLEERIEKSDDKRWFIRGVLHRDDEGKLVVGRTGTQSSGALSSMSRADCIIILDEGTGSLDRGATVDIELL